MSKKCLKCLSIVDDTSVSSEGHLSHIINNWTVCNKCKSNTYNYSKEYYKKNKDRYKLLQKSYKDNLTDYYIKKLILDNSKIIKSDDIPNAMVEAKRNHLKLKKITRSSNEQR